MFENVDPDRLEELFKAHFGALCRESQLQLLKELAAVVEPENTKEHLILDAIRGKYALHFRFDSIEELREFEQLLKPLGYKFRFPER